MTIPLIRTLEDAALAAHRYGGTWQQFFYRYGDAIRTAESDDRGRYLRLVDRLMFLVASGDTDRQRPVGDDNAIPRQVDAQSEPVSPHYTVPAPQPLRRRFRPETADLDRPIAGE
jgi:hypothetical protein